MEVVETTSPQHGSSLVHLLNFANPLVPPIDHSPHNQSISRNYESCTWTFLWNQKVLNIR